MILLVLPWTRAVIDRLFILPSAAIHRSPAHLFATNSALVPSDNGASWADYIPRYLKHGFTTYALRLNKLLHSSFGLGFPLQTEFPLHSPFIIYDLLDGFVIDDLYTATHLSRCIQLNLIH